MKTTSVTPNTLSLVWEGLLDLLYPPHCLLCRQRLEEGALCAACLKEMQFLAPYRACDRCGVGVSVGDTLCEPCKQGLFPEFEWSFGVGHYSGKLRRAIHLLKYEERLALAEPLGKQLARALEAPYFPRIPLNSMGRLEFDRVVPVPLHSSRYRQRGFNQSERLAQVVVRERGWQLDTQGLVRVRATRSQANLDKPERQKNMVGAFEARTPRCFEGQSVLLIDDVLTTTATVGECAKALKGAGAVVVCVVGLSYGG